MTIISFDLSGQFCSLGDVNKAHVPQSRNNMSSLITFGTLPLSTMLEIMFRLVSNSTDSICEVIRQLQFTG